MATWAPITGAVVQRVLASGLPASGYVLKLYAAGTSTNIPLATDTSGATQANYAVYNSTGDVTVSGNTIIPHVDQDYKLCIYATQAAADANSGAVLSIDNIPAPGAGSFTVNDAVTSGVTNVVTITHQTTGTPAAGIGTGLEFATETSTPGTKTGSVIESVATDVSVGSEDFDLVFKNMASGAAAAEKLRLKSTGQLEPASALNLPTGTSIASAATINLDAATGGRVHITGTTAITAVTLTKGPRTVIFDGILTLTHNATNNNLPSAANIITAPGDRAIYESDGTTVYCTSYVRAALLPDVSGPAASVDGEIALYSGTGGKTIKRASTTGLLKAAAGVISEVVSGTDIKTINGGSILGSGNIAVTGTMVLLSTVTASNSATADIETTFDSTYDAYKIFVIGALPATNGTTLQARLKVNGSYQTSSYFYVSGYPDSQTANTYNSGVSTAGGAIIIGEPAGSTNEASGGIDLEVLVLQPASTSRKKSISWQGSHIAQAANGYRHAYLNGSGRYDGGAQALTGVRFLFSSGNIASGTFRLYGIKNS